MPSQFLRRRSARSCLRNARPDADALSGDR